LDGPLARVVDALYQICNSARLRSIAFA
jgi:hypothetical protein